MKEISLLPKGHGVLTSLTYDYSNSPLSAARML